jgi:UDP-N-acetylglucosamine 2-epimerase
MIGTKTLIAVGTRPEAMKMAPLITPLKNGPLIEISHVDGGTAQRIRDTLVCAC